MLVNRPEQTRCSDNPWRSCWLIASWQLKLTWTNALEFILRFILLKFSSAQNDIADSKQRGTITVTGLCHFQGYCCAGWVKGFHLNTPEPSWCSRSYLWRWLKQLYTWLSLWCSWSMIKGEYILTINLQYWTSIEIKLTFIFKQIAASREAFIRSCATVLSFKWMSARCQTFKACWFFVCLYLVGQKCTSI